METSAWIAASPAAAEGLIDGCMAPHLETTCVRVCVWCSKCEVAKVSSRHCHDACFNEWGHQVFDCLLNAEPQKLHEGQKSNNPKGSYTAGQQSGRDLSVLSEIYNHLEVAILARVGSSQQQFVYLWRGIRLLSQAQQLILSQLLLCCQFGVCSL